MSIHRPRGAWRAVALTLGLALIVSCSSDDNVGGFTQSCLNFTPVKQPTAGEVVPVAVIDANNPACNDACVELCVELHYTGTGAVDEHKVWSASFEFDYPAGIIAITSANNVGSFLTPALSVVATEPVEGHVEVGLSLDGSQTDVGIAPPEANTLLMTLSFQITQPSGLGTLQFSDANLTFRDAPGAPLAPFDPPVPFSGGIFAIND